MPHSKLLTVADALNERLPFALAISADEPRLESWIRSEIEWVIWLRSETEMETKARVGVEWRSQGCENVEH
jgi:hypothetical protein